MIGAVLGIIISYQHVMRKEFLDLLLAANRQVDIVLGFEAVIDHGDRAIRIGREVDCQWRM